MKENATVKNSKCLAIIKFFLAFQSNWFRINYGGCATHYAFALL